MGRVDVKMFEQGEISRWGERGCGDQVEGFGFVKGF